MLGAHPTGVNDLPTVIANTRKILSPNDKHCEPDDIVQITAEFI